MICEVIDPPYWLPASSSGVELAASAAPSRPERLPPKRTSTHTVITAAPATSRAALMICTQVVPRMPPYIT